MSYILEALKKSERERQRAQAPSSPVLVDDYVPPRRRWLPWIIVGLLLALNIAVVAYFGLAQRQIEVPAPAVAVAPPQPSTAVKLEAKQRLPAAQEPPAAAGTAALGADRRQMLAERNVSEALAPIAKHAARQRDMPPAVSDKPRVATPARPAIPVLQTPQAPRAAQPVKSESEMLPLFSMLPPGMQQRIPPLSLNVLAYSQMPEERFAVINMAKYVKGDQLPGGAVLSEIRSDCVVLELDGKRFRITQR